MGWKGEGVGGWMGDEGATIRREAMAVREVGGERHDEGTKVDVVKRRRSDEARERKDAPA